MVYLTAIIFLASLAVLAVSSQILINSTLKLSRWFKLGEFAAGFIVLAMATSLPELSVTILSALSGTASLGIGNVIGANISDLLLVLGVSALIAPIAVGKKKLVDNAEILLVISLIPLFLLLRGKLDSFSGLVLVIVFALYVFFVSKEKMSVEVGRKQKAFDVMKQELVFGIALVLLIASSKIAVSSAVTLADFLGLPYATIGLTIVSLGTTMPELAVNISSMFRRKYDLALGNILGSCVTNLTLILGIGAIISGNSFDFLAVGSGIVFLLIANVLLTFTLLKFNCIPKRMGWVFIAAYLVFILAEIGLVSFA